jgi:hypothetical protein
MKLDTITWTERLNTGNSNHFELTASAKIEDTDNALTAMLELKHLVAMALRNELSVYKEKDGEETSKRIYNSPDDGRNSQEEQIQEEDKTDKKTKKRTKKEGRTSNDESITGIEVPAVIEESPEKEPKVVTYDSTIAEHKSIFGGYLAKKYDTKWKTVAPPEEIKAFTASLNGQPFLDDYGNILPVFLEQVHTFFGI